MTISHPNGQPRPVTTGRYRYSRWRWRALVWLFDCLGGALLWLWRRFRRAPRVDSPARILLIQLDHLGDSVLTTPMIPALRAAFPNAFIDVLASSSNRAVFEADPNIRHVVVAERNWFDRRPGGLSMLGMVWRLGWLMRKNRYDLGIDVRGDVLSILVLALAGIPRRVGWAMGGGGFLLTDVAPWVNGRHEVEARMALLACLGIEPQERPRVHVHISESDRASVARWLHGEWSATGRPRRGSPKSRDGAAAFLLADDDDGDALHAGRFAGETPLLAVHLGAGTSAKRWPLSHWRELVQRFLRDGWRIVVVGGPHEASVRLGLPPHPNLRDWTSQLSVTQTTALLERADLFIGADSGPAHLAACAAVPSVTLFSGTNRARQWRPWSRASLVLRHRVPCQPCHRKVCPLANHPCLTRLSVDRVYRAARRLWSRHDGFKPAPALSPQGEIANHS